MPLYSLQPVIRYHRARYLSNLLSQRRSTARLLQIPSLEEILRGLATPGLFRGIRAYREALEAEEVLSPRTAMESGGRRSADQRRLLEALRVGIQARLEQGHLWTASVGVFEGKVTRIGELFELAPEEVAVFRLATLFGLDSHLCDLMEHCLGGPRSDSLHFMAEMLALPLEGVRAALRPGSRLILSELMEEREPFMDRNLPPAVTGPIRRVLSDMNLRPERLLEGFGTTTPEPRLDSSDFPESEIDLEVVTSLLGRTWSERRTGVNILLYGGPGLGKTQLARLVARRTSATSMDVPVLDPRFTLALDPSDRRVLLEALQRLCRTAERPLIVVDEADEMLNDDGPSRGRGRNWAAQRKSAMTVTLDTNPVPVIWIVNRFHDMHPAVRRRFAYSVYFPYPSWVRTVAIWGKELEAAGSAYIQASEGRQEALVASGLSPGQINRVVETWAMSSSGEKPRPEHLERILHQTRMLAEGPENAPPEQLALDDRYDIGMLQLGGGLDAGTVLSAVQAFFARSEQEGRGPAHRKGQMTMLFHGPSGAGKTELVKYLSHAVGRPLHIARMSDLLSMWLGESEKNIARVFHRAAAAGSILLLDEIDALAYDREKAMRRYEVSMVSELLQQIEDHHGVLVGCTNLKGAIDNAFFRRFAFKVEFLGIWPDQRARAVMHYFGGIASDIEVGPEEVARLRALPSLMPGDLRSARNRVETRDLLGKRVSFHEIIAEIASDVAMRERGRLPVGFRDRS